MDTTTSLLLLVSYKILYSHCGGAEDSILLDVTLCCWVSTSDILNTHVAFRVSTSGILKNHTVFNLRGANSTRNFYYPKQHMHNIYTNNILYTVSTPACFNASASSSGSLNLVLCLS